MGLGAAILLDGAPELALAGAASIEVHERLGGTTTYRIRYPFDIEESDFPLLADVRCGVIRAGLLAQPL